MAGLPNVLARHNGKVEDQEQLVDELMDMLMKRQHRQVHTLFIDFPWKVIFQLPSNQIEQLIDQIKVCLDFSEEIMIAFCPNKVRLPALDIIQKRLPGLDVSTGPFQITIREKSLKEKAGDPTASGPKRSLEEMETGEQQAEAQSDRTI